MNRGILPFQVFTKWVALQRLERVKPRIANPLVTALSLGGIARTTEYAIDTGKEQLLSSLGLETAREKGAVLEALTTKPDKGRKR